MHKQSIPSEQLLILARQGNKSAYDELFNNKFLVAQKVIRYQASQLNISNPDISRYEMYFFELFETTVERFKFGSAPFDYYFFNFINLCIKSQMIQDQISHKSLRNCISLNFETPAGDELCELIENTSEQSPIDYVDSNELKLRLSTPSKDMKSKKKKIRQRIIDMKLSGYSYRQISQELGIPTTTVRRYALKNNEVIKLRDIKIKI